MTATKDIRKALNCTLLVICLCFIQRSLSMKRHNSASANIELAYNCRRSSNSNPMLSGDLEWDEMVATNPYQDRCPSEDIRNKMALRLCILELLWTDEITSVMPRMRQHYYNFESSKDKLLRASMLSPPGPGRDCFTDSRRGTRAVPTDCYGQDSYQRDDWIAFFEYISNDLRFTFDYVLNDEISPNMLMENKLWYLILYLKAMAREMPNPYWIVKLVTATAAEEERFDSKVLDAQNRLLSLEKNIKESRKDMLRVTKEIEKLVDTVSSAFELGKIMQ